MGIFSVSSQLACLFKLMSSIFLHSREIFLYFFISAFSIFSDIFLGLVLGKKCRDATYCYTGCTLHRKNPLSKSWNPACVPLNQVLHSPLSKSIICSLSHMSWKWKIGLSESRLATISKLFTNIFLIFFYVYVSNYRKNRCNMSRTI